MLRRVLVPLDGSTLAESVLLPLTRLLRDPEPEVLELQRVVEHEAPPPGGLVLDAHANEARAYLVALQRDLEGEGLPAEVLVDRGRPAERILARIAGTRPDLVAMATHGRTGLTRLVRGSVAEAVLRRATAPLLLVNPQGTSLTGPEAPPFARALVPLDGSRLADEVLEVVEGLSLSQAVVLACAPEQGTHAGRAAAAHRLESDLAPRLHRLREAGLEVHLKVAYGAPAPRILEAARELAVDLIAMTTHGRGGFDRLRFGSVAEQVLREGRWPLVVKRGAGLVSAGGGPRRRR